MRYIFKVFEMLKSIHFILLFSVFMLIYTISVMTILNREFIILHDIYDIYNDIIYFTYFISVPFILIFFSFILSYIDNMMRLYNDADTSYKYISTLVVIIVSIISFYFYNQDYNPTKNDYTESYLIKKYREYNNPASENNSTLEEYKRFHKDELLKKEFIEYKYKTSMAIQKIKTASLSLTLSFILYLIYLLISIDIKKFDLSKSKYYIKWYLSETLGWIKGTSSLRDEYTEVLIPYDCIKILEVQLNSDVFFIEHKNKYDFLNEIEEEELLSEDTYNMLRSLKTVFIHYDKKKVSDIEKTHGNLPQIIKLAKKHNLFSN